MKALPVMATAQTLRRSFESAGLLRRERTGISNPDVPCAPDGERSEFDVLQYSTVTDWIT
jgi:hypothetical protein